MKNLVGETVKSYLGTFKIVDIKMVFYIEDDKGHVHTIDRYLARKIFPELKEQLSPSGELK